MKGSSRALAYGSVCVALSVVLLYLSAVLPTARLAMIAAASVCSGILRLRCGRRWALSAFAVCTALSALLLPEKAPAALYGLFLGYYPIIKPELERLSPVVLRWAAKLGCFNAAAVLLYLLVRSLGFSVLSGSVLSPLLLLLAANVAFIVYDLVLSQGFLYYLRHFSGRI